jgi:branched-chain amino acid transport system substrate-binding protein
MSDLPRPYRLGLLSLALAVSLVAGCGEQDQALSDGFETSPIPTAETVADPITVPVETAPGITGETTTTTPEVAESTTTTAPTVTTKVTTKTTKATTAATQSTTTTVAPTTVATVPTTVPTGPPTKSPIIIGVPVSLTGAAAGSARYAGDVALAWQQWVNAEKGGINGHPVKVVIKDTKTDPVVAAAVIKDLVETEKIIVSVGGADESAVVVWTKALSDAGIPNIPSACFNAVCSGPTGMVGLFQVTTGLPSISLAQPVAARAVGASKAGRLAISSVGAAVAADASFKAGADAVGLTYVGTVAVDAAAPNFTAECLSLKSQGVDFLQASVSSAMAERIVEDCARQDYTPIFGASGTSFDGETIATGKAKSATFGGLINSFPWWLDTPEVKQYRDVMAKYAPGKPWRSPNATGAWAAFEMFRKATTTLSDNPSAAEIMGLMTKVSGEKLGGLAPVPLTFTAGKPSPAVNCFWIYRYSNGVTTGSTAPSCYP